MTRSIAHMMAAGSLGAVFLVTMDHADGQTRPPARPTLGRIERLDPGLDSIVAPDAKMEIIGNGFDWTEGPLWIKADGGQHAPNGIDPYVARLLDRHAVTFAQPSPALEIGQNVQGKQKLGTLCLRQC